MSPESGPLHPRAWAPQSMTISDTSKSTSLFRTLNKTYLLRYKVSVFLVFRVIIIIRDVSRITAERRTIITSIQKMCRLLHDSGTC